MDDPSVQRRADFPPGNRITERRDGRLLDGVRIVEPARSQRGGEFVEQVAGAACFDQKCRCLRDALRVHGIRSEGLFEEMEKPRQQQREPRHEIMENHTSSRRADAFTKKNETLRT